MNDNYLKYPLTIGLLSQELKKVVDDYSNRLLSNLEFQEIILHYSNSFPDKVFTGEKYTATLTRVLGKKRLKIIDSVLEDYFNLLGVD